MLVFFNMSTYSTKFRHIALLVFLLSFPCLLSIRKHNLFLIFNFSNGGLQEETSCWSSSCQRASPDFGQWKIHILQSRSSSPLSIEEAGQVW